MLHMIGVFLVFAVSAFAAPELSDRIRVEKVHGPKELRVIRAAGGKEEMASAGDMLFVGDTAVTAKGQVAELSAFDGSSWAVAPESRLKLESRKPDKKTLFYWTFELIKGGMWGEVPKDPVTKDGYRLKTKTKYAAMGVRGTEYLVGGDDSLSTLDVLKGTVWWGKSAEFAEGSYQEISAGQHAEMGPDGRITVRASVGDKPALARYYGVVPGESPGASGKNFSKEECLVKGKGWKSDDGSSRGECID